MRVLIVPARFQLRFRIGGLARRRGQIGRRLLRGAGRYGDKQQQRYGTKKFH